MRDRCDGELVIFPLFHHVGVVTNSLEASSAWYEKLGYERSRDFHDPIQKVTIVLLRREGSPLVELISPAAVDSPAAGWLKRIKAGPYHTCYEVPDLASWIERLGEDGFAALHVPVPAVAFEQRKVVFLWSNSIGLLELLEAPAAPGAACQRS